ncbi:MAG: prepilin-type N-terminal cleavage/methylation domain-containing protein [bacterium]|nr:prepilin-type N-terminal cleavage/methylation domain-containing protein [bacterium]
MKPRLNPPSNAGISLVEAIVSLAIFSLVLTLVYTFFTQGNRIQSYNNEQQLAVQSARRGVQTMVKELREASTGDDGSYILSLANDQEIVFFSDTDADLVIERIRYFLDGTSLKKAVTEPTGDPIEYLDANEEVSVLSEFIRNDTDPIFTYYNGDFPGDDVNNPLPTPSRLTETKMMDVYLKVNVFTNRSPDDIEVSSYVQIRNLKTNL